jgi:putative acetyltransferase
VPSVDVENPRQDDVLALLQQGDDFALSLYAPESYYGLDIAALERPEVTFYVAREDGVALGAVAIVDRGEGSAEIKRMFVTATARGLGVGRSLLAAVETHAQAAGISRLLLETGLPQAAAISLYERAGFNQIPRFGQYVDDPSSYCMEKLISHS